MASKWNVCLKVELGPVLACHLLDSRRLVLSTCADYACCLTASVTATCLQADHGRVTVGLTGYPNVGKSSTINALFGSKKTAVAPTPGKTKHFQTLNITDGLTLCDCPGLVLPRYAQSKSEMVAAGTHLTSHSMLCYANLVEWLCIMLVV